MKTGMPTVSSGSAMTILGIISGWKITFLVCVVSSVMTPARPTSEPVPAVVGTAMIGWDGHRGWVSYLAVEPDHRGLGYARTLMAEAERLLIEAGCPKLMLMVRSDNSAVIELYEKLGYALETTLVMGKRLIPDV